MTTLTNSCAEREVAKAMICDARQIVGDDIVITRGASKDYGDREFVEALQEINASPDVHQGV